MGIICINRFKLIKLRSNLAAIQRHCLLHLPTITVHQCPQYTCTWVNKEVLSFSSISF